MAPDGDAPAVGPGPLVSVVVATFNSRLTLACALDSVRGQSFTDFEVWVVGDACTDGSDATVAALGDPRFHWTNLPWNSGSQAGPNNEGTRRARGRFVAYLGHDDLWLPWHLETLVDTASSEGALLVHGLGVMLGPGSIAATGPPRRGASYRGHCVPPTNWLVDRALLERVGPWSDADAIGRPVDIDVLDRIAATGARIACVPRLTTIKFPSPHWRAYAADAPRPQIAMSQELARDAGTLAARLLCDVAAEHARATMWTWAPPPSLLWRDVARSAKTALGATVRRVEHAPLLGPLLRWRFQRLRRRGKVLRGLNPR